MANLELSWPQVLAWRLRQQHLAKPAPRDQMLDVVSNICGLQAQVMSAAALALSARVEGITADDVAEALWKQRTLVKLWIMRGTLHLLPASDLALYVAAISTTHRYHLRKTWLEYFRLSREEMIAFVEAANSILSDKPMTRAEFSTAIVAHTGAVGMSELLRSGWGSGFKPASYNGYLCFGPSQGSNVTFVHPRHWLGDWQAVDETDALREVVRRYLHAYAPATTGEFALWWGVNKTDATKMFALISDEIVEVAVEGWKGWALAADVPHMEKAGSATNVRLLPNFDTYTFTANRGISAILAPERKARVYRVAGWISPVLLVNGVIAGVWQYKQQRDKISVQVEPFSGLSGEVEALVAAEAERIGRFFGSPSELTYGRVNFGKMEAGDE
jgi:hypothetical protein